MGVPDACLYVTKNSPADGVFTVTGPGHISSLSLYYEPLGVEQPTAVCWFPLKTQILIFPFAVTSVVLANNAWAPWREAEQQWHLPPGVTRDCARRQRELIKKKLSTTSAACKTWIFPSDSAPGWCDGSNAAFPGTDASPPQQVSAWLLPWATPSRKKREFICSQTLS